MKQRWMPKTMTGLVAGGYIVAATPLVIALLLAAVVMDKHADHSDRLVHEGLSVARLGTQLSDDIRGLERNVRQYFALSDPALLDVFQERADNVRDDLDEINERTLPDEAVAHIARLREGIDEMSQRLVREREAGGPVGSPLPTLKTLLNETEAMVKAGRTAIDAQVDELRGASANARLLMLIVVLALIPLTAVIVLAFSLLVARPFHQMRSGMIALGHGNYRRPISIHYPREMETLGEHLDWLRRRLAQLENDKDRFLRHVSHELKTPLASLQEGAALLHEGSLGSLSPEQREVAGILFEATTELDAQIENLLAYAAWTTGHQAKGFAWFEVAPLVNEVVRALQLSLSKRDLSVSSEIETHTVFGQRQMLRTALDNLLTNAIKHAPERSRIEIRARLVHGHCEISVRDRGCGVRDEDKDRIFEPFERGAESEEARIRGTGVGLSIVREVAHAHNGTAEVEDANPGARFRLVWPYPDLGTVSERDPQRLQHDAAAVGEHANAGAGVAFSASSERDDTSESRACAGF